MSTQQAAVRLDEVEVAAQVVIVSALGLRGGEKLVVLSDSSVPYIGDALTRLARRHGCEVVMCRLEEFGARPFPVLPDGIVTQLLDAQASVFVASSPHAELGMRQHLLHLVQRLRLRHAHMPNISSLAFSRGMRLDYRTVAEHGARMLKQLAHTRALRVESPAGTALEVLLSPHARWYPQLGVLEPGRWGNLPAGALYVTPEHVHGRFVADASVGEYFGVRHGLLEQTPVHFVIEDGRVTRVSCPRAPELQRDIVRMLACAENSNRIGLICLGVNPGIHTATGEALVDQNLAGVHLSIGDPAAKVTGAGWSAPTAFAACGSHSTVLADAVGALAGEGGPAAPEPTDSGIVQLGAALPTGNVSHGALLVSRGQLLTAN